MEILVRVLCVAVGYCFGLIQTAYIYGKLHGIDIREYGSGNSGTTNALRVLGKRAGLVVFLGDLLKATAACVLARVIGSAFFPDMLYPMILWAGLGVVIGHNFPFYMNFKGGKGIAATAGVILGLLDWRIIVLCLLAFILCVAVTRYVSLGSLIVVTLFFIAFMVLGMTGQIINPKTGAAYEGMSLLESYGIIFLFASLAFYRHKANIVRLIHGEENKIFSSKKEEI
ncbi:MAG: glycerol-3-phosphate 1-O-acyltransferase PlsY [Bacteroidales bacterium]|nr:glycerol-3-phosphate 1-O-acyltransferase PlsY [Clostridium sp.]MCM1203044.1 glycerol-3-phosphate 1-O-acyltransferase PlsY [Bacteroidales bacterium]